MDSQSSVVSGTPAAASTGQCAVQSNAVFEAGWSMQGYLRKHPDGVESIAHMLEMEFWPPLLTGMHGTCFIDASLTRGQALVRVKQEIGRRLAAVESHTATGRPMSKPDDWMVCELFMIFEAGWSFRYQVETALDGRDVSRLVVSYYWPAVLSDMHKTCRLCGNFSKDEVATQIKEEVSRRLAIRDQAAPARLAPSVAE